MYRFYNPKKISWSKSPYKHKYVVNMPYEGCGPMYKCPHYCPVHLFAVSAPPETEATPQPLRVALFNALKLKFDKYEEKVKRKLQENDLILLQGKFVKLHYLRFC